MVLRLNSGIDCIIDDVDYDRLIPFFGFCWSGHYVTLHRRGDRKKFYLHRFLMNFFEPGQKMVVDHINRNVLDNRKENLRIISQTLNRYNSNSRELEKTGVTFIPYKKDGNKIYKVNKPYRAEIKKNKKRYYLGNFKTQEEAKSVYLKKRMELFGI